MATIKGGKRWIDTAKMVEDAIINGNIDSLDKDDLGIYDFCFSGILNERVGEYNYEDNSPESNMILDKRVNQIELQDTIINSQNKLKELREREKRLIKKRDLAIKSLHELIK